MLSKFPIQAKIVTKKSIKAPATPYLGSPALSSPPKKNTSAAWAGGHGSAVGVPHATAPRARTRGWLRQGPWHRTQADLSPDGCRGGGGWCFLVFGFSTRVGTSTSCLAVYQSIRNSSSSRSRKRSRNRSGSRSSYLHFTHPQKGNSKWNWQP